MSAGFATVLILSTTSLSTNCWIKRCFNSMCFAFFDDPIRVAMLFPLKSPCRFWCWLSSCWVLPSRSFGRVVLLLLLCWWRRVLLLRCWMLLLTVCGCRSVSLLPWTWWQSPYLTSALLHILPSRGRRRLRHLEWCPLVWPLAGCRTCNAVCLWCIFGFCWFAVVGPVKDLASSFVA